MKTSVIICTFNPREENIRRTIEGLQKQTLPRQEWELLVVDNASSNPLANRLDLSWHPHSRHLLEPKPGKLNAWLLGMRESRADILIFVDDDNVLAPDYLEQAVAVGEQKPFLGAWGGSVIPEYEAPLPDWVGDQVWRLTVIEVKTDIWSNLRDEFHTKPVGAGLCVRRAVADRYLQRCGQNQNSRALDRSGTGLGGYGDMDLCQCAIDIGLGTGRFKGLTLTHLIPASRLTLDYFVRHAENDAASYLIYRAIRGLPYRHLVNHSWFKRLIWHLHCLKHRVPREQRQIHAAYARGLKRGLLAAEEISSATSKT